MERRNNEQINQVPIYRGSNMLYARGAGLACKLSAIYEMKRYNHVCMYV